MYIFKKRDVNGPNPENNRKNQGMCLSYVSSKMNMKNSECF